MFLRHSLASLARAYKLHVYDFFFMSVHLGLAPPPYEKAGYATVASFRSPEEWPLEDGRFRPPHSLHEIAATGAGYLIFCAHPPPPPTIWKFWIRPCSYYNTALNESHARYRPSKKTNKQQNRKTIWWSTRIQHTPIYFVLKSRVALYTRSDFPRQRVSGTDMNPDSNAKQWCSSLTHVPLHDFLCQVPWVQW